MAARRRLRFGFTVDGQPATGEPVAMRVTYLGPTSRRAAEADARRRFEEWCRLSSPLARHLSADQVVLIRWAGNVFCGKHDRRKRQGLLGPGSVI